MTGGIAHFRPGGIDIMPQKKRRKDLQDMYIEREVQMSGRIRKALTGGFALGAAAMGAAGGYLARKIVRPRTYTLEQIKKYETSQGGWEDYDKLPHTTYTVVGKDGYILHCEYVEADSPGRKFVILTHGYTSNRYGAVKYANVYRKLGFNCVMYDCRGHGENAPAPCSIGNIEAQDLRFVIADTYQRFGADIELGLHGESMGSSTSLIVLKYQPKVKFVVADCGFACLYDLIKVLYQKRKIGFMLNPVNVMMKLLYGFSMKKTCARDALHGNKVPLCLIHGNADSFIDPSNSDVLAAATDGYQEVHKVDGAEHALSRTVLGAEKYAEIVEGFLKHIGER